MILFNYNMKKYSALKIPVEIKEYKYKTLNKDKTLISFLSDGKGNILHGIPVNIVSSTRFLYVGTDKGYIIIYDKMKEFVQVIDF